MKRAALKLVDSPTHQENIVNLWPKEQDEKGHSLHYLASYPNNFPWSLPHYFIQKFTQKGELVLDPFCSTGASVLEAALLGRVGFGVDIDPLAVCLAKAKLNPCDITEVTLLLQQLNLSRPCSLDRFRDVFSHFYSVDTFHEVVNLRAVLGRDPNSRIANFTQALSLGLLHGHSASYFSTYSFPHVALNPREQFDLNLKRCQSPDYRAVVPRLLKRAAVVTSDGLPVALRLKPAPHRVWHGDARNLANISSSSVSLTVTAIPFIGMRDIRPEQWLKNWFLDLDPSKPTVFSLNSLDEWTDFMSEFLLELARVTKSGGRAVLDCRVLSGPSNSNKILLDRELLNIVENNFGRFWSAENTFIQEHEELTSVGTARANHFGRDYRVLVLRRN